MHKTSRHLSLIFLCLCSVASCASNSDGKITSTQSSIDSGNGQSIKDSDQPRNIILDSRIIDDVALLQAKRIEDKFESPYDNSNPNKSFFDYLKMRLTNEEPYADWFSEDARPPKTEADLNSIANPPSTPQASWIGHSTALVQYKGINVLTDPIFSEYASPVQFAGPKRIEPPALEIDQLPPIDVILMSHNHYDHLDEDTVASLSTERFSNTLWMVPMGMKEFLVDTGIKTENVFEFNWWQSMTVKDITITSTPSIHWTGRGLWDRNEELWAAWHVDFDDFSFWFGGDTGYHETLFKDIAKVLGPVDLGIIPIGAYKPRSFMKFHHVNPEEAVAIHKDIKAIHSFGIHWGTFQLTGETLLDPPKQLKKLKSEGKLTEDEFNAIAIGETISFDNVRQIAKE